MSIQFTFQEKTGQRYRKITYRRGYLKPFLFPVFQAVLFVYSFFEYLVMNWKRWAFLLAGLVFFLVNASFCAPILNSKSVEKAFTNVEVQNLDSDLILVEEGMTFEREEAKLILSGQDMPELESLSVMEEENLAEGELLEGELPDAEGRRSFASADEILQGNSEAYGAKEGEKLDLSDINTDSFSKDDWNLILVNKQHPIPDGYTFELGTISGSLQCDKRIIDGLYGMLKAARRDGVSLIIASPYRSQERQEMLFARKIDRYMGNGMSYMDSYNLASQAVTVPGASEHQLGLALDIITDNYSSLNAGFGETKAGKWLAAHSHEYGFILRYPLGKEYITSIEYEPWHFRYVGVEAATVIYTQNLCLEEFWESYLE